MKHAIERQFAADGAQLFRGAVKSCMAELEASLGGLSPDEAGVRIHGVERLKPLLSRDGCIGAIAAGALDSACKPVRAILFNKTPAANWSLGWHQDRTICVRDRLDVPGFGGWTMKRGMNHVEPPFALIARMVTLRVHLDDVPATNAPLLIAPGSHRFGRIKEADIADIVARCGTRACLAEAGDVWLYATPILHSSQAAATPKARRVLQVDFADEALPSGLEWLGV